MIIWPVFLIIWGADNLDTSHESDVYGGNDNIEPVDIEPKFE